jgi:hypothetical protein
MQKRSASMQKHGVKNLGNSSTILMLENKTKEEVQKLFPKEPAMDDHNRAVKID